MGRPQQLQNEIERLKDNPGLADPEDAKRILDFIDAYDPNTLTASPPDTQETKSTSTLAIYTGNLRRVAQELLIFTSPSDAINAHFERMYEDGTTKKTIRGYQNAIRQFLYLFLNAEASAEEIPLFKPQDSKVDPTEMLEREDIKAARKAADCIRDLALFDFLLYTGQRNTAVRTIRVQDIDLDEGRFRLNSRAEGLKGADKNGMWRDLLLSEATIRQYLRTEHPDPDNPDAYLFTARPNWGRGDPETPISHDTIARVTRKLKNEAGIEKPMHPHALRHNFVTIALRRGVPESTIKHQIGHNPGSQVMETTYAHLKDSDHIRAARNAFGKETEEAPDETIPETCHQCGANVPEGASICGVCHTAFTLDGAEKKRETEQTVYEGAREASDTSEKEAVDQLRELLDENPGLVDAAENLTTND